MERINLKTDIKPLSEFRSHVASYIDHVQKTHRPLLITQHGKSAVVLMDVEEYESIFEELETIRDIQISRKQIAEGKVIDFEDVKKKFYKKFKNK